MRLDTNNDLVSYTILGVLFLIFIVFMIRFQKEKESELDKYGRFTIAYATGTYYKTNGNKMAKVHFFVNGRKIDAATHPDYSPEIPGRYYIRFSIRDPEKYKEVDFLKPVPSRIQEAPLEGWKDMPKYLKGDDRLPRKKKKFYWY